ncbi:unnamed protein product [Moneuplotes crassus]|uniref:Anoctamin transmembrane domain-containing protein n=1 Tax=Euplotes crassus TaxID=5936 RepID=A0AAD2D4V2_EUPCR|nr:unnamed protein product [Moneuplotes crassus]
MEEESKTANLQHCDNLNNSTTNNQNLSQDDKSFEDCAFAGEEEELLDTSPPCFEKCKKHREAWKVKNLALLSANEDWSSIEKFCQCCHLPLYNAAKPFQFCTSNTNLGILGLGFTLFYKLKIFHCCIYIALCVVAIVISTLYLSQQESASDYNSSKEVSYLAYTSLGSYGKSIQSSEKEQIEMIRFIYLACLVSIVFGTLIFECCQVKFIKYSEREYTKASDFAVIASNIPVSKTEQQIKEWFKQNNDDGEPQYVSLCYDIKETTLKGQKIEKLKNKRASLRSYLKELEDPAYLRNYTIWAFSEYIKSVRLSKYHQVEEEIKALDFQITELEREVQKAGDDFSFCGTAFIIYDNSEDAFKIREKFEISYLRRSINFVLKKVCKCKKFTKNDNYTWDDSRIFIDKPAEPNNYIWENLSAKMKYRVLKTFITFLKALGFLFIAFSINYVLNLIRDQFSENDESNVLSQMIRYLITFITMLFVSCTNIALGKLIRSISNAEKHHNYSTYHLSVSIKLTFATFINTGISPLIVNFGTSNWFHSNGLAVDVFWNTFSVCFIGPLLYLFDPAYLYKLYKIRSEKKKGAQSILTQRQANLLFEGPQVDMAQRYSNSMLLLSLAMMYSYLFPIIPVLALFGVIFQYQIEKYLLLNRHKLPVQIGSTLSKFYVGFMPIMICVFGLSIYMFAKTLFKQHYIEFPIISGVLVIYYLSPLPRWMKRTIQKCNKHTKKSYKETKLSLFHDYNRANPVTRRNAVQAFLQLKQQELSKNARDGYDKMNTSTDTFIQIQTFKMKTINTRSKLDDVLNYKTRKSVMDGWLYSVPEYDFKFLEYLYSKSIVLLPKLQIEEKDKKAHEEEKIPNKGSDDLRLEDIDEEEIKKNTRAGINNPPNFAENMPTYVSINSSKNVREQEFQGNLYTHGEDP